MKLSKLSKKQKILMKWAFMESTKHKYKAVVCDGAVRSGKTVCMITAYVLWAMAHFKGEAFAITGKTVQSAERNIIMPLMQLQDLTRFYTVQYTRSQHLLTVTRKGKSNCFYIFGGRDESSYMLIQGITLAGVLFDEVALMPQSFVEQAIARTLSVPQAKLWFNCNPGSPGHWFYKQWILGAVQKHALHLHFLMSDNPILTPSALEDAARMYAGVFYDRYILGKWVAAEGLIYTMFSDFHVVEAVPRPYEQYAVSCDYGTINPTSMGLWGLAAGKWYRIREYYFDSREQRRQCTDQEYLEALVELCQGVQVGTVIIDPSAASFIELVRRAGFHVVTASNRVVDGIREVAQQLQAGNLLFQKCCVDCIREFGLYRWDEKATEDKPIKENDHAMDDVRYFVRWAFRDSLVGF